jgi:hypothetical protein
MKKTDYELVEFEEEHARVIFEVNEAAGKTSALPVEEVIKAYTSKGSVGVTLLCKDVPVASGGIINMEWNRGEAWLLTTPTFWCSLKTTYYFVRKTFPILASLGGFIRVQATSFNPNYCALFRHLGFAKEGTLAAYGPHRENAILYSRIFTEVA